MRHLQKFMATLEMILLYSAKAMRLLLGMLEKILLKAVLVTILLTVVKESIQLFIEIHPQLIL